MLALYRTLALPVYVPSMLMAIGQALVAVMLPLYVIKLGGHPAQASLVIGALSIGSLLSNVPAGVGVSRYGDKIVMSLAVALSVVADTWLVFAASIAALAVAAFVLGTGTGMWMLSRLAYMSEAVPLAQRGRAISLMGGTQRLGGFVGPAAGGLLAVQFGFAVAFAAALLCFVVSLLLVRKYTANHLVVQVHAERDDHSHSASDSANDLANDLIGACTIDSRQVPTPVRVDGSVSTRPPLPAQRPGLASQWHVLRDYRGVFATAGIAVLAIAVVRGAYGLLIPLWGTHIGLDPAAIGITFSILSSIDMLLFYPVGIVMDRYGRKWAGVPCLVLLGVSLLLLPATISFWTLGLLAMLFGLGNGLGSGIVMTMGSDLAPRQRRGEFLGVWRSLADLGFIAAPLMISALTVGVSLTAACIVCGVVGLVGAFVMAFKVRESLHMQEAAR